MGPTNFVSKKILVQKFFSKIFLVPIKFGVRDNFIKKNGLKINIYVKKKQSGSKKFRARVLLCSKDEVKKFKRVGGSKILGLKIIWVQNFGPKRVCAKKKILPKNIEGP